MTNETPAKRRVRDKRRARELFWAKYFWHAAIERVKDAKSDALYWRAKIEELEAKR